ncbi:Iron-sulfur flavoprotein [uncultured archaeon]|nr:Iron-sulfur flavoprotein [uncultured archaeon]
MKVLAINSSPHKGKGNTALILNPFLDGMREAGAEVELFYTSDLKINPCYGDFSCWTKTPGRCYQKDDMNMLYPKIACAEILVVASPVYILGLTGPMKMLMDRMVPLLQPFFELRAGQTTHSLRHSVREKIERKIVLVSSGAQWEMDCFDAMLIHLKAISRIGDAEFAGALLRPNAEVLRPMLETGAQVKDILDAAKEAGRQLVHDGRISPDTLRIVSRELLPRDTYIQLVNQHFQEQMNKLES